MTEETNDVNTEQTEAAAPAVAPVQPRKRGAKKDAAPAADANDVLDGEEFIDLTKPEDRRDTKRPPVYIRLTNSENFPPNGQPFGVNGRFFALRPDVWYKVPGFLPLSIKDCVAEKPLKDDNDKFIGTRKVPAWPFETRKV